MFGVVSIATDLGITIGAKDFTDTVLNPEEPPLEYPLVTAVYRFTNHRSQGRAILQVIQPQTLVIQAICYFGKELRMEDNQAATS